MKSKPIPDATMERLRKRGLIHGCEIICPACSSIYFKPGKTKSAQCTNCGREYAKEENCFALIRVSEDFLLSNTFSDLFK